VAMLRINRPIAPIAHKPSCSV